MTPRRPLIKIGEAPERDEPIAGVAIGFDEDGRLSCHASGTDELDQRQIERLARELEYWAGALRAGRRGPAH